MSQKSTIIPYTEGYKKENPSSVGSDDYDINASTLSGELMNMYYDAIHFETIVGIVIPVLYAMIIFIGVFGNILVITVVALNRQMRNSTNTLIINLALADLLFLAFCVPFTAADFALPIWVFAPEWCACLYYFQFVTAYASVWTLVLMAFDRFLAVVFPVQSLTLRTVRNTILISAAIWFVILTANIPQLEIHGVFEYLFVMEQRQTCAFVSLANRTAAEFHVRIHFLTFSTFGYVTPLIITCILYFFMLRKLWFRMPVGSRSRVSEQSITAKRKVTWMVTGVIVTFAICWLPLNICFAYTGLVYRKHHGLPKSKAFVIIMMASQVLAYTNSCLNPILYAFLSGILVHKVLIFIKMLMYQKNSLLRPPSLFIVYEFSFIDKNMHHLLVFLDNFRKGFFRILSCLTTGKTLNKRDFEFERTETRFTSEMQLQNRRTSGQHKYSNTNKFSDDGELVCLKNGADNIASNIDDNTAANL